ncbi:MAG: hypothetical protein AAFQ76_07045, partial [Cyanobacteria bacterium J06626_26]
NLSLKLRIKNLISSEMPSLISLASLAVRNGDENSLKIALLAHVIEDFRIDPRENLMCLPVISHVADRLGLNVKKLFKWAATLASESKVKDLLDHCNSSANYFFWGN